MMMIRNTLALVLLLLLSTGCQPIDFEPEPYEPISSFVTNQIDSSEPQEDIRPLYVSNTKPRELDVRSPDTNILSPLLKYCWSEQAGECSDEFNLDINKELSSYRNTLIKPEESMFYSWESNNFGSKLPRPTTTEFFQYQQDGTLTPLEIDSNGTNFDIQFQGPSEVGKYFYVVKATYEEEVHGISYYAFHFTVRE